MVFVLQALQKREDQIEDLQKQLVQATTEMNESSALIEELKSQTLKLVITIQHVLSLLIKLWVVDCKSFHFPTHMSLQNIIPITVFVHLTFFSGRREFESPVNVLILTWE